MKIKQKLVSGIGLLFVMIVFLTVISSVCIHKLANETKNILVANYNTLDYSRNMLIALNENISSHVAQNYFEENLNKQQKNITEIGEQELTKKLRSDFQQLKNNPRDTLVLKTVRKDISEIMLLNMQAIGRKSKIAENTADDSILWIGLIGTLCFIIAFTLLINLPGNIANPIRELSNSIKEIAAENYSQRVHFEKHNEFGDLARSFNSMAEKLEEFRAGNLEKIFMEKKRIETLVNNMNEPVVGVDDVNRILFMNDNALKITGLKAENVIGKPADEIAAHNDLLALLIKNLSESGSASPIQQKFPLKIYADGKESYFEKEFVPIKIIPTGEKDEKLIGNVILLKNITEYKELDFAKTNFIATISHELKTPISSIKASIQLLEKKEIGHLNAEQKSLIENIDDDISRLLKITGELLNMTQVESGIIQLAVLPVGATEIVDYAVDANKSAAELKKIIIRYTVCEPAPMVLADNEKTAWVLTNLISNAIRYSYENAEVLIDVQPADAYVNFTVTDHGQGIAPQYISKIFKRYFRIPGAQKGGTGLGLSISKEFMEAQGGSIAVESEFAKGSKFIMSVPIYRE